MSDANFNITTTPASTGGGSGGDITSTTSLNAFIDNDNNSTTEAFNIYKNVNSPSSSDILFKVMEDGRIGFNTNLPFVDFGSASGDFASTKKGIHIKNTGANESSNLILEGGTGANSQNGIYFACNSQIFKLETGTLSDSIYLSRLNADLTEAQLLWSAGNSDECAGFAIGMPVPAAGNSTGLYIFSDTTITQNHPFMRVLAGTEVNTALEYMRLTHFLDGGFRVTRFAAEVSDGGARPDAICIKNNLDSLSPSVGINTYQPTAPLEVNRRNLGTTIVKMGGDRDSNSTGYALSVYRNLTSTSTNSPVTFIHQDNTSDDQPALRVQQDAVGLGAIEVHDSSNTLFQINGQGGVNYRYRSTAVNINTSNDYFIGVDTGIAVTITLSTADVKAGRVIVIKDITGGALANNITIDTEGAELIDGVASVSIITNYGARMLFSNGTNWFTTSSI